MSSNPGFPVLPLPVAICPVHGPHVLYPRNAICRCPGAPVQSLQTTGLATQGPAFCVEPWPETTATGSGHNYYYKRRHNGILETLADWLASVISSSQNFFVDITSEKFHPVGVIFKATARPDTVIRHDSELFVLELTVCHESNLMPSKTLQIEQIQKSQSPSE